MKVHSHSYSLISSQEQQILFAGDLELFRKPSPTTPLAKTNSLSEFFRRYNYLSDSKESISVSDLQKILGVFDGRWC